MIEKKIPSINKNNCRIVVLTDNNPNPNDYSFGTEHGLSIYIDINDTRLLLDVGASDVYIKNAEKLGIDISMVDYLILSHAHKDHTGGLCYFLKTNNKAKIYLSSNINNNGYYSTRRGSKRNISIDYQLLKDYKDRFEKVYTDIQLTPSVKIISNFPIKYSLPKANKTLLAGNKTDNFNHEIALSIKCEKESILLSSCTHLGLLNTLCTCEEVSTYIGGLHLVDSDDAHSFETDKELIYIGQEIKAKYPQLNIFTGHCTGIHAINILSKVIKNHIFSFYSGFEKWFE